MNEQWPEHMWPESSDPASAPMIQNAIRTSIISDFPIFIFVSNSGQQESPTSSQIRLLDALLLKVASFQFLHQVTSAYLPEALITPP